MPHSSSSENDKREESCKRSWMTTLNELPVLGDVEPPVRTPGQSLLSVAAAPLNPIDISVATGRFFAGHPDLPYVPGVEMVGHVVESDTLPAGIAVFTCLDGLGVSRNGTVGETVVARDDAIVVLPEGVDLALAAGLGTSGLAAWIPLHDLANLTGDDIVLVLGATGTAGLVAVQVAKLMGAARVVAAGRRPEGLERARRAGADDLVVLEDRADPADLAGAFTRAAGGAPTVVYDPLWGPPLAAALTAAAPFARIIQTGQSAAPDVTLASAPIRGKNLSILGYTNLNVTRSRLASAYTEMLEVVRGGGLEIDVERFTLAQAPAAWARQAAGPGLKLVICPQT